MTANSCDPINNPPHERFACPLRRFSENQTAYAIMLFLVTVCTYVGMRIHSDGIYEPGGSIVGRDYLAFFMAGRLVETGQTSDIYDFAAQSRWQNEAMAVINPRWKGVCLYLNPPHYAWLMSCLTRLGYTASLLAWWGLSLLAFAATVLIWRRWSGTTFTRSTLLLVVALPPWFQAFAGGQNSFFTLLILTVFAALLIKRRELLAGLVLSLLAYKFQYILLPAGLLLFKRRWRALIGLGLGGVATATFTLVAMGPQVIDDYIHLVLNLDKLMQQQGFDVYKQHSWYGFFELLLGGTTASNLVRPLTAGAVILTLALLTRIWRGSWQPQAADFPFRLAALFIAALATSPHLFHYDMLLIALPAILCLISIPTGSMIEMNRLFRRIFVIGFIWLAISGLVTPVLPFQFTPLLMFAWLSLIARTVAQANAEPTPAIEVA